VTTLDTDIPIVPTTYVVNSNADPGDGVCDATCTLRDAILTSNLIGARDTIAFNLPAGQTTIAPTSDLPTMLDPVIVDGSTQPGFAGSPLVQLSGVNAGLGARGLHLNRIWPAGGETGSTFRGLVINRFSGVGLDVRDSLDGGNIIVGNFIGTNLSGFLPQGNGTGCTTPPCLSVPGLNFLGLGGDRIGGPSPADRNVVAGNVGGGPQIAAGSLGSLVAEGNNVGLTVSGVGMSGCCYSTMLQASAPEGVIANNRIGGGSSGIEVRASAGGPGITIKGNRIGANVSPASFFGIDVYGSGNVVVGTQEPGGANVISFNGGTAVRVNPTGPHVQIRFNRIFANGLPRLSLDALGIDLGAAGVTPNDPGDADAGPNNLQNFPELSSVAVGPGTTTIDGTLNSTPDTAFEIDFYANAAGTDLFSGKPFTACDSSGYGEGQTYLGTASVKTLANGTAPFSHTVASALAAGAVVTATATDPTGNTSEFSACKAPAGTPPPGTIVVVKQTFPSGSPQSFAFTTNYGPTFSLSDGQSNTSGAITPGTYSVSETAVSGWDASASCSDGSPPGSIGLGSGETVTCTFTNTGRGSVTLRKTTNGVVDPSKDILFVLTGPGLPPVGISRSTVGDQDGVLEFGTANLSAGQTYKICESPVPAGFTSFWKLDGVIVTPYNPDANQTPPEDLGTRCYDFSASPGQARAFEVDNSHPGGDSRTIGYWKNWNRCTGGSQSTTAQKNGGAAAGFFLVEDLLPQTVGDFTITTCEQAVKLLSKRDQAGRNKASDAAYELGAQLLAARFNLAAGAETCAAVQQAVVEGQTLLDGISFSGSGDHLGSKSKDPKRAQALSVAANLDRYNNGTLC